MDRSGRPLRPPPEPAEGWLPGLVSLESKGCVLEEPALGVVCYSWHCERGFRGSWVLEGALDRAGGGSSVRCRLALPCAWACDPFLLEVFPSVKQAAWTSLSLRSLPERTQSGSVSLEGCV